MLLHRIKVWTSFAKEHEIEGKSKGQFATELQHKMAILSKHQRKKTSHSSKQKIIGKECLTPIVPSTQV